MNYFVTPNAPFLTGIIVVVLLAIGAYWRRAIRRHQDEDDTSIFIDEHTSALTVATVLASGNWIENGEAVFGQVGIHVGNALAAALLLLVIVDIACHAIYRGNGGHTKQ